MRTFIAAFALLLIPTLAAAQPTPGNRLAYLDEIDPYYPHAKFPKLITPQWVGEPGVEAVVILAIYDMRDTKKYETFLRPILRRLQKIDGRAPVSIMTNAVDPKDPQLQTWLKEGLSLECHTLDHPCPFFKDGFAKAESAYNRCVDLMNEIPNNKPVAFRMPCCDSLNTPSPRFFAEIFNRTTDRGKFLGIDSSVFNVFTADDPELPRELVMMTDGQERFRKYLPKDRSFVNFVENYPYPYVIGRLCWQFPCMTPSDWQAQHLHKPNNPQTVKDWQAALDCTVIKKGVMTMVFHPHGWIKNDQLVELVDYADKKYGKKVKFLNFREARERLNEHLLSDEPLRDRRVTWPYDRGLDNGVRLLDANSDGYMDVVLGGGREFAGGGEGVTRIWSPATGTWKGVPLPPPFFGWVHTKKTSFFKGPCPSSFGVTDKHGLPTLYVGAFRTVPGHEGSFWQYDGKAWDKVPVMVRINPDWLKKWQITDPFSRDCNVSFRDIDGDGSCELVFEHDKKSAIFRWSEGEKMWKPLPFSLPTRGLLADNGHAAAAHFLDLDGDGKLDLIFSNQEEYGVYLFKDMKEGWSHKVIAGKAGEKGALPMIAKKNKGGWRGGWIENMGFFVHSGHLWWSNEDTALFKDHVARVSIKELLEKTGKSAK